MPIEVLGLTQAKENFNKLDEAVQKQIGRDSMRYFGWLLAKPMRAATYTTFNRQTGAIRQGIGVAVQGDTVGGKLGAWVTEYPQTLAGAETPFKRLVRKRNSRKAKRSAPISSTAFWWRFLEFGTGPRHAMRSVKVNSNSKAFGKQLARYRKQQASPSRGAIVARNWLRPAFDANASDALKKFRDKFLELVDAAVSAMPKR